MATTLPNPTSVSGESRYLDLVAQFPLRPIRSDADYDRAVEMMQSLLPIDRNIDEDDYLHILGDLIAAYDAEHHALPTLTQGGVLRVLMEERDVTQAKVAAATGIADSNISAILADRRGISRANRAKLAEFFNVKPTRFQVD